MWPSSLVGRNLRNAAESGHLERNQERLHHKAFPAFRGWTHSARGSSPRENPRVQNDHPELRPLAERCLTSFGSPAGSPMLPNGGYNSNYIIVQTADHVMIMTEMVHDARIIRIGDGPRLPPHIRPWMGDSWGHWEGDVLVVETTNIHPLQPYSSADMKVTERFSRMSEDAVLYEFTVDDPSTYTESWGGQIPMMAMYDQIYETPNHAEQPTYVNDWSGEESPVCHLERE